MSPAEAARRTEPRTAIACRSACSSGRPVYRFGGRDQTIVFADTGDVLRRHRQGTQAHDVARRYAPGHTGTASTTPAYADRARPVDDAGAGTDADAPLRAGRRRTDTHLYVSEVTGDVVLRTTRTRALLGLPRTGVSLGVLHAAAPNGPLWSEFVIWSSLIGCVMCVTGIVWGLWRYSPRSSFRLKRVPSDLAVRRMDEVASLSPACSSASSRSPGPTAACSRWGRSTGSGRRRRAAPSARPRPAGRSRSSC